MAKIQGSEKYFSYLPQIQPTRLVGQKIEKTTRIGRVGELLQKAGHFRKLIQNGQDTTQDFELTQLSALLRGYGLFLRLGIFGAFHQRERSTPTNHCPK